MTIDLYYETGCYSSSYSNFVPTELRSYRDPITERKNLLCVWVSEWLNKWVCVCERREGARGQKEREGDRDRIACECILVIYRLFWLCNS